MFCPPYKGARKTDITQNFYNIQNFSIQGFTGLQHNALDFARFSNMYGTFLVAPEDVTITNIIDSPIVTDNLDAFKYGYGLLMKGKDYYHCYWHCLPVFPVSIGQTVKQGEIVAQMGNSGYSWSGGGVTNPNTAVQTKAGTHLHWEVFTLENGARKYVDPLPLIDWAIPINYSVLKVVETLLQKLLNIFRK